MKNFGLIFLLSIITLSAFGQAGSLSQSVYRSRVNDSTTVNGSHSSGYGDFYWNNQASTPGWRVWNGSSYDIGFSSGGNFWKNAGATTITGDVTVDNGVHNILIGDITGPWSSWDIDGSGPTTVPNSQSSGAGDPSGTDFSYFFNRVDLADNNGFQVQTASAAGGSSQFNVVSTLAGVGSISFQASDGANVSDFLIDNKIDFSTNSTDRFRIDTDGSWDLGAGHDAGTAGEVLTSNGAGAAPTWQSPTWTTLSVTPTGFASFTTNDITYIIDGKMATIRGTLIGTGNTTLTTEFTLPFTVRQGTREVVTVVNNTAIQAGLADVGAGGTLITFFATVAGGNFTASVARRVYFTLTFEIQ